MPGDEREQGRENTNGPTDDDHRPVHAPRLQVFMHVENSEEESTEGLDRIRIANGSAQDGVAIGTKSTSRLMGRPVTAGTVVD